MQPLVGCKEAFRVPRFDCSYQRHFLKALSNAEHTHDHIKSYTASLVVLGGHLPMIPEWPKRQLIACSMLGSQGRFAKQNVKDIFLLNEILFHGRIYFKCLI